MTRRKRSQRVTQLAPSQHYADRPFFSGFGTAPKGDPVDRMKRRLLDEAQYLTGIGDSRGQELEDLTRRLPLSSLQRIAG